MQLVHRPPTSTSSSPSQASAEQLNTFIGIEQASEAEADTEADVDVDVDVEAEAEAEAEAETDANVDTDVDADAVTEAEMGTELEADSDMSAGVGVDASVDAESGWSWKEFFGLSDSEPEPKPASHQPPPAPGPPPRPPIIRAQKRPPSFPSNPLLGWNGVGPAGVSTDARVCLQIMDLFLRREPDAYPAARVNTWRTSNPTGFCTESLGGYVTNVQQGWRLLFNHPGLPGPFIAPLSSAATGSQKQLTCSSLWAEAAVGSLELALKARGQYSGPLSVQQVLDCVKTKHSEACHGGNPVDALEYFKENHPMLEKDYPSEQQQGRRGIQPCRSRVFSIQAQRPEVPFSQGWEFAKIDPRVAVKVGDYQPCNTQNCNGQALYEPDMIMAVRINGPYLAYVDASNFSRYVPPNRIFDSRACSNDLKAPNMLVELVGFGTLDGQAYWYVRNVAWLEDRWGDDGKGFIKLPFGVNACGLFNFVGKASTALW